MIERAEIVLRELGFRICRVRHHDPPSPEASAGQALARLEIGRDELARALEPAVRDQIVQRLRALGYKHVTIDLQGYRMGSLNEGVVLRPA
jgi:pyridinium-3,5-biscarboxylic acid mononucleotide sulfurtransferase